MIVRVHYSAQLRPLIGRAEDDVDLPKNATVQQLLQRLADREPAAARHLLTDQGTPRPSLLVSINETATPAGAAWEKTLHPGDRITLLPPISGG